MIDDKDRPFLEKTIELAASVAETTLRTAITTAYNEGVARGLQLAKDRDQNYSKMQTDMDSLIVVKP